MMQENPTGSGGRRDEQSTAKTDSVGGGNAARIEALFGDLRERGRVGVMTHIVFGYPTVEVSRRLVDVMVRAGVDLIEIQLPFSDPIADGPVITRACQKALDGGVRVEEGIAFLEEMTRTHEIPFLLMSYYNLVFNYHSGPDAPRGVASFARAAARAGAAGLIVPDVPPDEVQEGYPGACREFGLHPIYVVSPNIGPRRLQAVKSVASGFVYCTSRTGTTGRDVELQLEKLDRVLDQVREVTGLPLALGFSISARAEIKALEGKADMAVVGSHLIRVFDELGLAGLERELWGLTGKTD